MLSAAPITDHHCSVCVCECVNGFAESRLNSETTHTLDCAVLSVSVFAAGDGDSKWSVRYTTQKPQQGLIFVPGKRRSGSADDLQGQRSKEVKVS